MNDAPDIDMETLASLARLRLTDEEKSAFSEQIRQILGFFQQLQSVDVRSVAPMAHPFDMEGPLREDIPGRGWTPERALMNAPETRENQLVVPKVIEEA